MMLLIGRMSFRKKMGAAVKSWLEKTRGATTIEILNP
jgi:hypothetical protein